MKSEKDKPREENSLPAEKKARHKFTLIEIFVFLAMGGILYGLLLPKTELVPEPFVQFLSSDSPQDQTLRVIARLPFYYLVDFKTNEPKSFNKIKGKIELSVIDSDKKRKRRNIQSFPEIQISQKVFEALRRHYIFPDLEVRKIVPEYDFSVPVAWYKTEQGTNHVVYHQFHFSFQTKESEELLNLFETEHKRKYQNDSEKDHNLLDIIHLRQNIKIRTDQELQDEIANALEQIRKFPSFAKIKAQKEKRKKKEIPAKDSSFKI